MTKTYTRRNILRSGARPSLGALVAGGAWGTRSVESIWAEVAQAGGSPRARFLSRDERRSLEAAADELIPEGDGMPAAGDVGAVAYIEVVLRHWPDLRKHIKTALKELDRAGRRRFQNKFRRLDSSQRIELLETFEKDTKGPASDPGLFTVLSDLVYEAYYTSPKVWPLIGYKHHTPENGPPLEPFDPRVLAQVQERPKSYREIE